MEFKETLKESIEESFTSSLNEGKELTSSQIKSEAKKLKALIMKLRTDKDKKDWKKIFDKLVNSEKQRLERHKKNMEDIKSTDEVKSAEEKIKKLNDIVKDSTDLGNDQKLRSAHMSLMKVLSPYI